MHDPFGRKACSVTNPYYNDKGFHWCNTCERRLARKHFSKNMLKKRKKKRKCESCKLAANTGLNNGSEQVNVQLKQCSGCKLFLQKSEYSKSMYAKSMTKRLCEKCKSNRQELKNKEISQNAVQKIELLMVPFIDLS